MRVAHVTATFPPYRAGMGNVCFYNTRELARLGHDVTVITARQPRGHDEPLLGVKVRRLPALLRLGNAPLLPHLLSVAGFDIIHLHIPFIFGAELTWINALRRGLPYVVTYHMDLCALGYRKALFAAYQTLLLPPVLRDAALIMPTTLDYARVSRLAPVLAQRPDKVADMPNGVDIELFHPRVDTGDLRRRYGLGGGDVVVLFVAALDRAHRFKGLEVLLRALTRLRVGWAKALVVGEGELKASYMRLAQRLGLGERVIFCGRVPQEQLAAYYAVADCLVLPSITMDEAFGLVLLEAMACATPVVASNLPGVRAVVSDGIDGLLTQPASVADLQCKLEMLLADATLRSDMGQQGRAKVQEKYAWEKIARRLEHVYHDVLSKTQRAR
jgi:glycosyltransferase involved in cell wall biosynthesis